MALDQNGFITTPPAGPLQNAFQPVVNDLINQLTQSLTVPVHSIYVYGSVAQGSAVAGHSDLDISLILTHPPTEDEQQMLTDLRINLVLAHPVISKIDFDIGTLAEVQNPANHNSWGYWLKHHCRCIYGEDLRTDFPLFRPSRAVAFAVSGDMVSVLNRFIRQLRELAPGPERLFIQRAAARKLVRATNMLRKDNDTDWPDTLEENAARFVTRYPEQSNEMGYLLTESHSPTETPEHFIQHAEGFMAWLEGCVAMEISHLSSERDKQ